VGPTRRRRRLWRNGEWDGHGRDGGAEKGGRKVYIGAADPAPRWIWYLVL
jgi:hypothetical protein